MPQITQLILNDFIDSAPEVKPITRVERTLEKMRSLHEELNAALRYSSDRPKIHSPEDAAAVLAPLMQHLQQEEFYTLTLDTRNGIKSVNKIYRGSVNMSTIRIQEVLRPAILENAPSILIAHNHPSGDPDPSPEDISVTRAIKEACKLFDIDLLDHLIIGHGKIVSLKERGYIK